MIFFTNNELHKEIWPKFLVFDAPPNESEFLAAAKEHAGKLETAASGTAASNKASSSSGNNAMTHGPTSPPGQGNTGPPSHRFQAAVQGANTGPGPGIASTPKGKSNAGPALQSGTIEASSSGNHDKAVTDATTKPSSPSPAGQNANPQVHATTNVRTSRSGVTYDTRKASQSNTGRRFQFGSIEASSSGGTRPTSQGQSNAGPRQFQFGTIDSEPSSSGNNLKDVSHVTTTKLTSPGQSPPSQVHASAPGPQVGTNFDPNAPSSSDPILGSSSRDPILGSNSIKVHPGFGHDLQEPKDSQKK